MLYLDRTFCYVCTICFHFYTAVKTMPFVMFNKSCTKFIVSIIMVVSNDNDNINWLICFVESCHFTNTVYIIMIIMYQSRHRIFRVNILNFVQYGGSNKCPDCYYLTITWRQTEVSNKPRGIYQSKIIVERVSIINLALPHHWSLFSTDFYSIFLFYIFL